MTSCPFFQQQAAAEKARKEADKLLAMAEGEDDNELQDIDQELQDDDNDNSEKTENENENDNSNDNSNSDKIEIENGKEGGKNKNKKKDGKGRQSRKEREKGGKNNKNGKRNKDGSVSTRMRGGRGLNSMGQYEDELLDNDNLNDEKRNGDGKKMGTKRNHIEMDRRFDALTDRLVAGDVSRDDYIAIIKALDNGKSGTDKDNGKRGKKKGKHGTIVCCPFIFYVSIFPFGVLFCACKFIFYCAFARVFQVSLWFLIIMFRLKT